MVFLHSLKDLGSPIFCPLQIVFMSCTTPGFLPALFAGDISWVYPAPCVFLYKMLLWPSLTVKHGSSYSSLLYLSLPTLFIGTLAFGFFTALIRANRKPVIAGIFCAATLLLSYPIAFSIHQGNIETLLWPILALGVYALLRDRWWAGCLLVGLAASFKLYPIVFLVLAVSAKKWKPLAAGLALICCPHTCCAGVYWAQHSDCFCRNPTWPEGIQGSGFRSRSRRTRMALCRPRPCSLGESFNA